MWAFFRPVFNKGMSIIVTIIPRYHIETFLYAQIRNVDIKCRPA